MTIYKAKTIKTLPGNVYSHKNVTNDLMVFLNWFNLYSDHHYQDCIYLIALEGIFQQPAGFNGNPIVLKVYFY